MSDQAALGSMPIEVLWAQLADMPDGNLRDMVEQLDRVGAGNYDPVRWQYLQALLRRSATHRPAVQQALEAKARQHLFDYSTDFRAAQSQAARQLASRVARQPEQAEALRTLYKQHAFKAILAPECVSEIPQLTPLAELQQALRNHSASPLRSIAEPTLDDVLRQQEQALIDHLDELASPDALPEQASATSELSALKDFRETWIKHNFHKLVSQIENNAPENPGPLNPQMLLVKTLTRMRDLSPEYLYRFVSYVDTLFWLEQSTEPNDTSKKIQRKRS